MDGIVKSYRRGIRTQHPNQVIIVLKDVDSKAKASTLVGKKVSWKTPGGKLMAGKILATHGDKGTVRARFEKALPGEAIGGKVQVK